MVPVDRDKNETYLGENGLKEDKKKIQNIWLGIIG